MLSVNSIPYDGRLLHTHALKYPFKVSLGTSGFEHLRKILHGGNLALMISDSGTLKLNFKQGKTIY
jgi:hypothetical protein